ncbi:MAG: transposase [Planctomycetes bacterium]|nr:transposase [Planctomycetota bacterium]
MPVYFVTFTCYGTWLHGDARGSHDRKATSLARKILSPDQRLEAEMRRRMNRPAMALSGPMRKVVREAILEHVSFRGWELRELNVRSNHVHLVVLADADGSRVLNSVKARATRALREERLVARDQPVWSERGSYSLLESAKDAADASEYVRNGQGPDLPDD